jgi:hypothetical protein
MTRLLRILRSSVITGYPMGYPIIAIMRVTEEYMSKYKYKLYLTENMYLSYVNDFLTVARCAEWFGITQSSMLRIINYYRNK